MVTYIVNFNPNWGTRFQHVDFHTFGPYSTRKKANAAKRQLIEQMGWDDDTNCIEILRQALDKPQKVMIGSGPYKTLKVKV